MRGFFGFLVVVAAIVLTVGFWRGWFVVDRERLRDDTDKTIEKVQKASDNLREPSPRDSRDKAP